MQCMQTWMHRVPVTTEGSHPSSSYLLCRRILAVQFKLTQHPSVPLLLPHSYISSWQVIWALRNQHLHTLHSHKHNPNHCRWIMKKRKLSQLSQWSHWSVDMEAEVRLESHWRNKMNYKVNLTRNVLEKTYMRTSGRQRWTWWGTA